MHRTAIALGCALLLAGATAGHTRPLRVISFNVLHGGDFAGWRGDAHALDERFAIAVEELRRLDPDVVGLQEASAGRGRGDVAARLATALGLQHVFAPVRPLGSRLLGFFFSATRGFEEGPALLSRFPVRSFQARELERCGEFYPRILLCAELDTPEGPLDVCSTHVDGGACQAEALRAFVRERRRPTVPFVLTGDLNATEDSLGVRTLIDGIGLVDAFRRANPGVPGPTVWQSVHAEERMARRRVDYVLVAAPDRPARIVASRIVLDAPRRRADGSVLWPSDHYGVLAEIDVFDAG